MRSSARVPRLERFPRPGRHKSLGGGSVAWSQHIAFLDSPRTVAAIRSEIRRQVERCAVHPATLMFALGNEIPPGIVRWHGRRKIERFLADLCDEARSASPRSLLTYVNYPP